MRLRVAAPPRPQIAVFPLGSLALLVMACVILSGMYASSRGPGLRFASVDRDGAFNAAVAIRVEVLSEQDTVVDGTPVPFAGLAAAVVGRLAERPDAAIVLVVSPEATYETMVAAYGTLAGLPGPPRIAFPAREPVRRG